MQSCNNLSVSAAPSQHPSPFVPSGHFPLIGGIGPWKGSQGLCAPSKPSPMRGRRHGEAVTDEVGAASFTRHCPPHQSPPATASPHRGSLWTAAGRSALIRFACFDGFHVDVEEVGFAGGDDFVQGGGDGVKADAAGFFRPARRAAACWRASARPSRRQDRWRGCNTPRRRCGGPCGR